MDQKTASIFLMIVLLGIGGLGGFIAGQSNQVIPTPEHQSVIDTIVIRDTKLEGFVLQPKCVDAGTKAMGEHSIVPYGIFDEGRLYEQSTWIWQRYGDTEISMTLWGPGEDLGTVAIEIGRLAANSFIVTIKGEIALTIPETTVSPSEGYYYLTVEIA